MVTCSLSLAKCLEKLNVLYVRESFYSFLQSKTRNELDQGTRERKKDLALPSSKLEKGSVQSDKTEPNNRKNHIKNRI